MDSYQKIRIASISMPLDLDGSAHGERRDSNARGTFQTLAWPAHNWSLHLRENPKEGSQDELVADGMPAFISFDQAAAAHFEPPRRLNRNFSGREVVVRKQDERARFEHVLIRPAELIVTVGGRRLNGATVTIGGYDGPRRLLSAHKKGAPAAACRHSARSVASPAPRPGAHRSSHPRPDLGPNRHRRRSRAHNPRRGVDQRR